MSIKTPVCCELTVNFGTGRAKSFVAAGVHYSHDSTGVDFGSMWFDTVEKADRDETVIIMDFNYPDINWSWGMSGRNGSNSFLRFRIAFLHNMFLLLSLNERIFLIWC